jgi:serine/threonine protein kinase
VKETAERDQIVKKLLRDAKLHHRWFVGSIAHRIMLNFDMLKRGFSFAPGYRLEQFLGRGQFGQVWRASAPGGTAAAIKFIDLSGSEGAKEHAGIKRVKQIRHANLMPITAIWLLDVHGKPIDEEEEVEQETITQIPLDPTGTTGDVSAALEATAVSLPSPSKDPEKEPAWLVVGMLLGGKSLQQRLRECVKNGLPGIPPKELLAYMDESAKGLDFLNIAQHDLGEGMVAIQHCDVKPANIVLIGSSAVVCDFGLARILTRNQVTATSASGTPAYMAPEAIGGKPSRTSDQYSLAVTYYHLRTGTLPISDGTLWEVLDAHRTGKLDLSRVPEHEQAVLRRATALDWEKRFDSNLDFVESLREALRAEGHTRPVMMPVGVIRRLAAHTSYQCVGPEHHVDAGTRHHDADDRRCWRVAAWRSDRVGIKRECERNEEKFGWRDRCRCGATRGGRRWRDWCS